MTLIASGETIFLLATKSVANLSEIVADYRFPH